MFFRLPYPPAIINLRREVIATITRPFLRKGLVIVKIGELAF